MKWDQWQLSWFIDCLVGQGSIPDKENTFFFLSSQRQPGLALKQPPIQWEQRVKLYLYLELVPIKRMKELYLRSPYVMTWSLISWAHRPFYLPYTVPAEWAWNVYGGVCNLNQRPGVHFASLYLCMSTGTSYTCTCSFRFFLTCFILFSSCPFLNSLLSSLCIPPLSLHSPSSYGFSVRGNN
jgi:hypothetical protein